MLFSYIHCDATPKHGGLQPQVCVLPTGLLVLCSLLNLGQASAYVLSGQRLAGTGSLLWVRFRSKSFVFILQHRLLRTCSPRGGSLKHKMSNALTSSAPWHPLTFHWPKQWTMSTQPQCQCNGMWLLWKGTAKFHSLVIMGWMSRIANGHSIYSTRLLFCYTEPSYPVLLLFDYSSHFKQFAQYCLPLHL